MYVSDLYHDTIFSHPDTHISTLLADHHTGTVPQNSIVVQFLKPLTRVTVSEDSAEGVDPGACCGRGRAGGAKVKPFNTQVGGLGPTNFYGISDGFLGLTLLFDGFGILVSESNKRESAFEKFLYSY